MADTNITPTPNLTETDSLQAFVRDARRKTLKKVLVAVIALTLGAVGYYGYKNPQLFRAAITELGAPAQAGNLYIPNYNSVPGDSGTIALRADLTGQPAPVQVHSVQFTLKWTPANALTLNENSLVFDSTPGTGTAFTAAELKTVNTSVPGQATISFFSSTAVSLPAGVKDVARLAVQISPTLAAGSTIQLQVTDVDVVVPDVTEGFKSSTILTNITPGTITLGAQDNLRALRAEATAPNQATIYFNDFISDLGTRGDYQITGANTFVGNDTLANSDLDIALGADQKSVVVTLTGANTFTDASEYIVVVNPDIAGTAIEGNSVGKLNPVYNAAPFTFYTTPATISPVVANTITVDSSTQLTVALSGSVNPATITPLNVAVRSFENGVAEALKVETITASGSTLTLTTALQKPDREYFLTFKGVQDTSALPLGNSKTLNFFGFKVPAVVVEGITPSTITSETDVDVVIAGKNLDTVTSVRLDSTPLTISQKTAGALTVTIPAGTPDKVYNLVLTNAVNETLTKQAAIVVSPAQQNIRVISEESRATPNRVTPDGTTKVKFWVLVEDPVDLASVQSVTINLEQIGGSRAQEMTKDTGKQPANRQWYVFETTVDPRTPTKVDAYTLPIEVRKGGEVVTGTVELFVTRDIYQSVAPTINQVYFRPATVPPDAATPVVITAMVTDPDGADTITSVVADLGQVGAGFVQLKSIESPGTANEQTTGFFQSDEFTIPKTTAVQNYNVIVTASDATGEKSTYTSKLTVSSAATGPTIDVDRSYLSPRKSVPRDEKTTFSIHAFISDPDGLGDITSVLADFGIIGIPPVELTPSGTGAAEARSGFYTAEALTIPRTAPVGGHRIQLTATDKSGAVASNFIQIDVTDRDTLGEAPFVLSDKNYTTPRVAINDGTTAITLYAFVRDSDDDIESVVANISSIGQVGPQVPPTLGAESGVAAAAGTTSASVCPANSRTIVCMTPSVKEGSSGQWFILSDVTIRKDVAPSSEPYLIDIIATDKTGKYGRGQIKVNVNDGRSFTNDQEPPKIIAAVTTNSTTIEVLFNESMSRSSVSGDGRDFTLSDRNNVDLTLPITAASMNADGTIVSLTTEPMEPGKIYVLSASNKLTDAVGVALPSGPQSRIEVIGFKATETPPVVDYVNSLDSETVEIGFRGPIRPTSVLMTSAADIGRSTRRSFNFEIKEEGTGAVLPINGVRMIDAYTIEVKTGQQKSNQKYQMTIRDLQSYAGVGQNTPTTRTFKGFNIRAAQQAAVSRGADLNGDGKVDFTDFTIFSAYYGQTINGGASGGASTASPLESITSTPDATVPITSTPSGGDVQ